MSETKKSTFEQQLFKAADKLRKNIDAAEYKYVVLGLVFIKYISETFNELYEKLEADKYSDPEDRDEYLAENVFFVPEIARWSHIHNNAKLPSIGETIDEAMEAIEKENKELKNVLPKVYGKANLDKASLGQLIDLISNTELQAENEKSKDLFGRVYEYFLGEFANAEGKKGGQFYTPKAIVKLMVEMIEPYKGRVYDPACGSGGMFVMSEKFVTEHQGNISDITVYGQESNQTTWKLSKMNLAIRNINSQFVSWNTEGSFLKDAHPDLKADFILANPPFNQKDWGIDILQDDARWKFGVPPNANANYGWMMHMLYHLAPKGVMATVLSNGSLSSNTSGEGDLRQRMVEEDLVECIVALPKQLFYNTGIPACIWYLRREKANHSKEVLFIDASEMGYQKNKAHKDLTDEEINILTLTYHNWRKGIKYENVKGYCKSTSIEEIRKHKYVLTPGRYVGLKDEEEDSILFKDKMLVFSKFLIQNTEHSEKLDTEIINVLTKKFPNQNWSKINFNSNKVMENIAQTVFKEWFGKYQISDDIPVGWRKAKINDFVEVSLGGDYGKETIEGDYTEKTICLRGTDLPDMKTGMPERAPIRYLKASKLEKCKLKKGDIVIEISGGTEDQSTGRVIYINEKILNNAKYPMTCVNFCRIIRPLKLEYSYFLYSLFDYLYTRKVFFNWENGTTGIKNLNLNALLEIFDLLVPQDEELITEFDKIAYVIFNKIQTNNAQSQSLGKMSETLLTKIYDHSLRLNNL